MSDIFLCTTITRNAEPYDVVVYFRCAFDDAREPVLGGWEDE